MASYSVTADKKACKVVVRARDVDAKQVLWGWGGDYGSTKDRGAIELYGRGTGRGAGDNEVWEWKLSRAGVASLQRGIRAQVENPKKYDVTPRENKLAAGLSLKIRKAQANLTRCSTR